MRRLSLCFIVLICLMAATQGWSQSSRGAINGVVKDQAGGVLQGARIEMQPQLRPTSTNDQGQFTETDVPAGTYTVKVSYVGFAPYTTSITVSAGQTAH